MINQSLSDSSPCSMSLEHINTQQRFKILALEQQLLHQLGTQQYDIVHQNVTIQSELDALQVDHAHMKSMLMKCNNVITQLNNDNNLLQQSHIHIAQHINNKSQVIMQNAIQTLQSQHEQQIAVLNQSIVELKESITQHQHDKTNLSTQISTLQSELNQRPKSNELHELQKRCSVDNAVINELRNQLKIAKNEIQSIKQLNDTHQQSATTMNNEINELKQIHQTQQSELQLVKQQFNTQTDALNARISDLSDAQNEIQHLQATLNETNDALQHHSTNNELLTQQINALQHQLSNSVPIDKYTTQQDVVDQLELELSDARQSINKFKSRCRAAGIITSPTSITSSNSHTNFSLLTSHNDTLSNSLMLPHTPIRHASIDGVKDTHSSIDNDTLKYKRSARDKDIQVNQLNATIDRLNKQMSNKSFTFTLSPASKQLADKLNPLNDIIQFTNDHVDISRLQSELRIKSRECESLRYQLSSLQEQHNDTVDELNATISDHTRVISQLESESTPLQSLLSSRNDTLQSIYSAVDSITKKYLSTHPLLSVHHLISNTDTPTDIIERNKCVLSLHVIDTELSQLSVHQQKLSNVVQQLNAAVTENELLQLDKSKYDDTKLLLQNTAEALNVANQQIRNLTDNSHIINTSQPIQLSHLHSDQHSIEQQQITFINQLKEQNDGLSNELSSIRTSLSNNISTADQLLKRQYNELNDNYKETQRQLDELERSSDALLRDFLYAVCSVTTSSATQNNDIDMILQLRVADKHAQAYRLVKNKLSDIARIRRAFEYTVKQVENKYNQQFDSFTSICDKQSKQISELSRKLAAS